MLRTRLLACLLSLAIVVSLRSQPATPTAPTATAPLCIGILGASVSDGFGCLLREKRADGIYEAPFRLATMVALVCSERPPTFVDQSSSGMGLNAKRIGNGAVSAVLDAEPQCVIALDFLFWYCYGQHGPRNKPEETEARRLASFEQGLNELARFKVPVVVGDIPDMSRSVGRFLPAAFMPQLASIEAANTRLTAWAKEHPNVRVVKLSKLIRQLHDENVVEIAGKPFAATDEQPLLQADQLHATAAGLAAIASVLVDELAQAKPELALPRGCDPAVVLTRARASLVKKTPPISAPLPADAGK
jgi:hypothetical protein